MHLVFHCQFFPVPAGGVEKLQQNSDVTSLWSAIPATWSPPTRPKAKHGAQTRHKARGTAGRRVTFASTLGSAPQFKLEDTRSVFPAKAGIQVGRRWREACTPAFGTVGKQEIGGRTRTRTRTRTRSFLQNSGIDRVRVRVRVRVREKTDSLFRRGDKVGWRSYRRRKPRRSGRGLGLGWVRVSH